MTSGKYLVFTPQGVQKGTLTDPFAGRTGITTGCMVGPPAVGEGLYATGYFNLGLTRFASASPHAATRPVTLPSAVSGPLGTFALEGNESVVFDASGNYYVGGVPPGRETAADPAPPYGFIFKFSPTNVLLATYFVPNGLRGADEIDLGTDQRTLYYTSEDNKIRVFRPAAGPGDVDQYREITITLDGQPAIGTAYAFRALPPMPDSPDRSPSGFLVAFGAIIHRLDPAGQVVMSYLAPSATGQYFALDMTPDAQSFWTATFQVDPEDDTAPPAGQIVRFHIPTGEVTAGPISTGAPNVWGLCVKREYTAAINTCYALDGRGSAVLDANGQPVVIACKIPEICSNTLDDDGDGAVDAADDDCQSPGVPHWLQPPDRENWEGDALSGPAAVQLSASDPQGQRLTFTLVGGELPAGLTLSADGLISGTIAYGAGGPYPRTLRVRASDGQFATDATFLWTVKKRNRPPTITNPGTVTVGIDQPITLPLVVADPDSDALMVTSTPMPAGLALQALRSGQSTADLSAIGPGPGYGLTLSGRPTIAGSFPVTMSVLDLVDVPPGAAPHQPAIVSFTIVVTNRQAEAPANRAPIARGNSYTTTGATLTVTAANGVLANDRDPDGDNLRVLSVNGSTAAVGQRITTSRGSVRVNLDGSLTYTLSRGASGIDTFTYVATDGRRDSNLAEVHVTIATHTDGDDCDHSRRRKGHRDGDDCDHDRETSHRHRDGDGCDHDRDRRGHRDGDDCDHDRGARESHDDRDRDDHDRGVKGHRDGDGCAHDRDQSRGR